jgi:site-specific DNA recombinase
MTAVMIGIDPHKGSFGYRLDPERPRDAAAVRVEPGEAVLVAQLFDWYLEPQATVRQLARRLTGLGWPPRWASRAGTWPACAASCAILPIRAGR